MKGTSMLKILVYIAVFLGLWTPASNLSPVSYKPVQSLYAPASVVTYISNKYKIAYWQSRKIVAYAYALGGVKFPTPLDILAIIGVESSFRYDAEHPVGPSIGLMQINISAHELDDPKNMFHNISKGVDILREYRDLSLTRNMALVFYNAGPARAREICANLPCITQYTIRVNSLRSKLFEVILNKI